MNLHAFSVALHFDGYERAFALHNFHAENAIVIANTAGGEGLSCFDFGIHWLLGFGLSGRFDSTSAAFINGQP